MHDDIAVAVSSERWGARVFVLVGNTTTLAIWQSVCVVCRKPFEVTTPIAAVDGPAFEIFTCSKHLGTRLNWQLASTMICERCGAHHPEGMAHVCDPEAVLAHEERMRRHDDQHA